MSRQIQIRRGDEAANDNFVGAIGEVTMDTTNNTLRVHDGQTVGGTVLAKQDEIPDLSPYDYVIEWQMPTAENNYTWYRKYKSGWVEQGGIWTGEMSCDIGKEVISTITLPIKMKNARFFASATVAELYLFVIGFYCSQTAVNFRFGTYSTKRTLTKFLWSVKGISF